MFHLRQIIEMQNAECRVQNCGIPSRDDSDPCRRHTTILHFAFYILHSPLMHYAALVPCVISSVVGYEIAMLFGIVPVSFSGIVFSSVSPLSVLQVILLAALCALVSILFCQSIKKCEHYAEKLLKNRFLRAAVGGAVIILLTLIFRTYDYNGAGMEVITKAISGYARYEAFLLKIIFTAITISAGYGKKQYSLTSKNLNRKHKRSHRAVNNAAKKRYKAYSRAKGRVKSQKSTCHAAKG